MTDFIYKGTIDHSLVDLLLEDFKYKKNNWVQSHSSRGYLSLSSIYMDQILYDRYCDEINRLAKAYIDVYPFCQEGLSNWSIEPTFNLQYYPPGKHYSVWHCENNGEKQHQKRHLVFMTYLNDVKYGGETEFLYQNVKVSPKKGKTLIWPASFTHTHRGIPAESEEKYIITGWFEFVDTEKLHEDQLSMSDEDFYKEIDKNTKKIF